MPNIDLPSGIRGSEKHPKFQEVLVNIFRSDDGYLRLPGIESKGTGVGVCRGAVTWRATGIRYEVSGQSLISVAESGAITSLGTIEGSNDVVFSEGQVNLLIIVKFGRGYRYNSTDGLVEITDPEYVSCVSADFIDGRHVLVPADGGPLIYSEIDNGGSFEPLSLFDAEELPDLNKAVINISNQLFVLGQDGAEIFRTNVDPDTVFTRREGGRVDVGYIGGLNRYKNSFMFIGRRRKQKPKVFIMSSGDAIEISTVAIEEILDKYTVKELELADSIKFSYKNVDFTGFSLPNETLLYYGKDWIYQSSNVTLSPWRGKAISYAYNKYFVSDRNTADIGELSDNCQEYGEDTWFRIKTYIRSSRGAHLKVSYLEADMATGRKTPEESVGVAISRDGKTFGQHHYIGLGEIGEYSKRIRWQPPGGVGKFESYCGIDIISTSDAEFSLDFLRFE